MGYMYLGSCKFHELSREQLFRMIRERFLIVKSKNPFYLTKFPISISTELSFRHPLYRKTSTGPGSLTALGRKVTVVADTNNGPAEGIF